MSFEISEFENEKYLSLETFRKNNQPVRTPVWFVIRDNIIYVATASKSGKIKRLQNNKNVRIATSDLHGTPKSGWINGVAYFADENELVMVMKLRKEKYGIIGKIINMIASRKGRPVVIGIKIQNPKKE